MNIYKITNLINNKIYIGQNINDNINYYGSGLLIKNAIKKYGKQNFSKEILEICSSKKELNDKEIYWIEYYKSTDKNIGYNIHIGGTGGKLVDIEYKKGKSYDEVYGLEKSKHIKELLSNIKKGKKRTFLNKELTCNKISKSLSGKLVKKETKEKISNTLKKFFESEKGTIAKNKLKSEKIGKKQKEDSNIKRSETMISKGIKPKKLDIHPSSKYWFFYDKENNLIHESLGNFNFSLKILKTNVKRIVKFDSLDECLKHDLVKDYKVYYKLYYEKNE